MRHFSFAFWLRNFILRCFNFVVELNSIFGGILISWGLDLNRETAKILCRESFLP